MNSQKIIISGTSYNVKFGFLANKILAKKWGLKTLGEIGTEISKRLNFKDNEEPTLEQFDSIGDLIHSGILSMQPDAEITSDDVVDSLLQDTTVLQGIIQLYVDSMPKAAPEPKNAKRVKQH